MAEMYVHNYTLSQSGNIKVEVLRETCFLQCTFSPVYTLTQSAGVQRRCVIVPSIKMQPRCVIVPPIKSTLLHQECIQLKE